MKGSSRVGRGAARGGARRAPQRGFGAALLLLVLVLGSMYALLTGVNTATADIERKRDDATATALRQAKEALIAYAATRPARPGALPCPDLDDNGIAGGPGVYGNNSEAVPGGIHGGFTCPDAGRQIGRLPWATLGLPDLRDANGERLWYVLSGNFRNDGSQVVNSDTLGLLNVAGSAPATGVVAIIFSPGQAIAGQNRNGAGVNDVVQYLEGGNADFDPNFVSARRCEQTGCPLGAFNDQVETVSHKDLFDAVENVVARRLETEIAPQILAYESAWGILPFAAPFDDLTFNTPPGTTLAAVTTPDRPQGTYWGRNGQINGLLPVAYDVGWTKTVSTGWVRWEPGAFSAVQTGGAGTIVTPVTCNFLLVTDNPPAGPDPGDDWRWICSFGYDGGGMFASVGGQIANVARSLALPFTNAGGFAVTVTDGSGPLGSPPPIGLTTVLQATGNASVAFLLNLPAPVTGPATVTITFPPPRFSPVADPASSSGWFAGNQWYRVAYYSLADGCRLGGTGCAADLTLQGAGGPPVARSALVLAGRNLGGGARTWTLANYFEGQNASSQTFNEADPSPPSFTVFGRAPRSPVFNDRIAVVKP